MLREISCSDKDSKTWLTAWDQSNYTHFLLIQTILNSLTQVSFHLEITCFSLGPDHQQAENIQSLKGRLKMQQTKHHILHEIPVLRWSCLTIKL